MELWSADTSSSSRITASAHLDWVLPRLPSCFARIKAWPLAQEVASLSCHSVEEALRATTKGAWHKGRLEADPDLRGASFEENENMAHDANAHNHLSLIHI